MTFLMTQFIAGAGGNAKTQQTLEANIRTRSLAVGEFLARQGEPAPNLYFIAKGLVKMFYITADGKEFVKSFIREGQITGSLSALMEGGDSTFSIVCLEPVTAEVVPAPVFTEIGRAHV
mgnify:CR=1 FL=1